MDISGKTKKLMICSAIAALTALGSCAPKKSFADSKTPLSENKPIPVFFSEWKGGVCSLNKLLETMTYRDKDYKETNVFSVTLPDDDVIGLHCSDEKTIIVGEDGITLYKHGAKPKTAEVDEAITGVLKEEAGPGIEILTYSQFIPNDEDTKNLASAVLDDKTLVLSRNTKTGEVYLSEAEPDPEGEVAYYSLGKLFDGNVNIAVHNGLLFVAGEAKKGENYVYAFKVDGKIFDITFQAEKDMKGKITFTNIHKQTEDDMAEKVLVLQIGENKFYIDAKISETKLKGFEDMGDGKTFAKIKITK